MTEATHRFALPLLVPGQAQKEMTHNEALALLDIVLHASVVAVGTDGPPPNPDVGGCWIVGDSPTGAWVGRAAQIAGWTAGGWRFVTPRIGMTVLVPLTGEVARYTPDGSWRVTQQPSIAEPVDGDVVDLQARTALAAVIELLRDHGWVAPEHP